MKHWIRQIGLRLPALGRLLAEREALRRGCGFVPPGHFYSPLPDFDEVLQRAELWQLPPRTVPGIDLRESEQLALLEEFGRYYREQPFSDSRSRYRFDNTMFCHGDALALYCMLRHARPRRIVEVGSGFSSAVMLDTNELAFANSIACTFIDPYPERLLTLARPEDLPRVVIHRSRVQDVARNVFARLETNDILFIDSSHVAKIGSDVNYLLAEIIPTLNVGVYVHFHDIPYPFEYFRDWIVAGRAWNEAYMVRAFLMFNQAYRIVFFNSFLASFHEARLRAEMPLLLKNAGASLWLQRVS